ncbi:hypothetical protein [Paenibacillus alvei]|nr:hypothetical protein [Paenibacillus alvei]MCY9581662.1 hypothetical protein [Paenibacillus alvei]
MIQGIKEQNKKGNALIPLNERVFLINIGTSVQLISVDGFGSKKETGID